jgi:tetratricopeptide (TPR) repeat protein
VQRDRFFLGGVLVAAVILAVLTVGRNAEYQSPVGIWQTVIDRRPHGRAHYNLAIELKEQGRSADAFGHYQLALADEPAAHYAVGFELDARGQRPDAIAHYREYVRLRPDDVNVIRAYVLLGRALKAEGHYGGASDAFREALKRQSSNLDARTGLADVAFTQRRFDEAVRRYREVAQLAPQSASAHAGLGLALVQSGRDAEAVEAFLKAVELEPSSAAARNNLGNALAGVGRLDDAGRQFRRGLELEPTSIRLHNALGLVLAATGARQEALEQFRQSMTLDPQNAETRSDFATAFPNQSPIVP